MIYKKLKKNILANSIVDFPKTQIGEDLIRIERKADLNTQAIGSLESEHETLVGKVQTNKESIGQLEQEYGSLITKTTTMEQSITNNTQQIQTLDSTKLNRNETSVFTRKNEIVVFVEGEIRLFKEIGKFNSIKSTYGLQENVDYQVISSGCLLKTGIAGAIGGNNYLQQSNLPNIRWEFRALDGGGGNTSQPIVSSSGISGSISSSGNTNPIASGIQKTWTSPGRYLNLNGNTSQTQLNPRHIEVYGVLFLRDITLNRKVG